MHQFLTKYDPNDISYGVTFVTTWSVIEVTAGIVCACLPVSKPVLYYVTCKLGLTGERGYISRLRTRRSDDDGTTARSLAAGDLEPGNKPNDKGTRTTREFMKYLGTGDATLLNTVVRPDSPETSTRGGSRREVSGGNFYV